MRIPCATPPDGDPEAVAVAVARIPELEAALELAQDTPEILGARSSTTRRTPSTCD